MACSGLLGHLIADGLWIRLYDTYSLEVASNWISHLARKLSVCQNSNGRQSPTGCLGLETSTSTRTITTRSKLIFPCVVTCLRVWCCSMCVSLPQSSRHIMKLPWFQESMTWPPLRYEKNKPIDLAAIANAFAGFVAGRTALEFDIVSPFGRSNRRLVCVHVLTATRNCRASIRERKVCDWRLRG